MGLITLIVIVLLIGIYMGFLIGFSRSMQKVAAQLHAVKKPVLPWTFIGSGLVSLIVAIGTSVHTWHFIRIAQRTTGTVTELRENKDKEGHLTYAPTVQFLDVTGVTHTIFSTLHSSPPRFQVGKKVNVLFRADNPKRARIDSFEEVWILTIITGVLGGIFLPAGLIALNWPKIVARFKRTAVATAS